MLQLLRPLLRRETACRGRHTACLRKTTGARVSWPTSHCLTSHPTLSRTAAMSTEAPRFDPAIRHLAVYGSLRDDDDSGAAWTEEFIVGLAGAVDGQVVGADIFWDLEVNYPKVIFDAHANRADAASLQSGAASSAGASPSPPPAAAAAVSPAVPAPLHVRLLSWPSRAAFESKMVEADEIENYDPSAESSSEYVRRRVWVKRQDSTGAVTLIEAWLYVMIEGTQPDPAWVRLESGDWMKRDRTMRKA